MSIAFRSCDARGLTVVVWDSVVTADEWRAVVSELVVDADYPPGWRILGDQRTVSDWSELTPSVVAEVAELTHRHAERVAQLRWAVVTRRTAARTVGFAQEVSAAIPNMSVFNYLAPACLWLGVNRSEVRAVISDLRRQLRADP